MVRNPRYTFELEELVRRYLQEAQNASSKLCVEDLNQLITANGHGDGLGKGQFNYLKTRFRNGELGYVPPLSAGLLDPSAGPQTGNAVTNIPKPDPAGPKTPVSLVATTVKPAVIPDRPVKPTPQRPAPEAPPYPKSLQVFPALGLPPTGSHRKADLALLQSKRPRSHEYPGTTHFGDTSSSGSPSPVQPALDLSKAYDTARTSALLPSKPPADVLPQPQAEKVVSQDPMIGHEPTGPLPFMQAGVKGQMKEGVNHEPGDSSFQAGFMQSFGSKIELSASAREKLRIILEPVKSFEHPPLGLLPSSIFFNAPGNWGQQPQSTNAASGPMEQRISQSPQVPDQQPTGSGQEPPRPSNVLQTTKSTSSPGSTTLKSNMLPPDGLTHPLPAKPVIDASQPKRLKQSAWHEPGFFYMPTSGSAQENIASAQKANMRMSQARSFPSSPIVGPAGYTGVGSKAASHATVGLAGGLRSDILGPNSGVPNLGGLVMPVAPSGTGGQSGSKRRFSHVEGGGTAHGGNSELHMGTAVHRQAGGVAKQGSTHFGSYPPLDMYSSGKNPASGGNTQDLNQHGNNGHTSATRSGRIESRSFVLGAGKDGVKKEPVKSEWSKSPTQLLVLSPHTENEEKILSGQPSGNSTAENPDADTVMTDDALAGLSKYTDEELSAAAMMDNDVIAPDNSLVATGGGTGECGGPFTRRLAYQGPAVLHAQQTNSQEKSTNPVTLPRNRLAYPPAENHIGCGAPSGIMPKNAPNLDAEPAPIHYVAPPDPGPVDVYLCGPGAGPCPISSAVVHFHCRRNGTVIFSGMGDFQVAAIMYQRSEQWQSRAGPDAVNAAEI
ncbi:uncharacterized protein PpBr36_06579 [Pyricularia pennisetigena]|uniref:uncharacterized protein n=1 Tax=Pyricularia pennisetigena TaxID=1578925 RepID=UPI00114F170B|nr:uncharacterized protein PpBr36_06579 [Pyricularia pennisetigena]TLS23231.1 hypothetical protein PpBr36_06579 [Pyricularia pennisetigena]